MFQPSLRSYNNDSRRQMHIDATYYITRVLIPPLERIFNLMGADVRGWYDEMPKSSRVDDADSITLSPRKEAMVSSRFKINEHFLNSECLVCKAPTTRGRRRSRQIKGSKLTEYTGLCKICRRRPQTTISGLLSRVHRTEGRLKKVHSLCASCSGIMLSEPVCCESLDCPWLYVRKKLDNKAENLDSVFDYIAEVEAGPDEESESSDENVSILVHCCGRYHLLMSNFCSP